MGFILQLAGSGSSRLLYMYLVAYLASIDAHYAVGHATQLGYAASLAVIFGLNVYQHNIARNSTNVDVALDACSAQYRMLMVLGGPLWAVGLFIFLFAGVVPMALLAMISGIALAQSDVTFSMATARQKVWRPILYYGGHVAFFLIYLILVAQEMAVAITVLASVMCLFMINFVAYANLRLPMSVRSKEGGGWGIHDFRERLATLMGNIPVVAMVPALIYLMGNSFGQPEQIPQLLLFISFAGAIVFLLSNTYHFYGHQWAPKLLSLQENGKWHALLWLTVFVLVVSFVLSFPVGVLLAWMKEGKVELWPLNWYFSAAIFAAGVALTQWYSVICLGLRDSKLIAITNTIYFVAALMSVIGGMVFYYALTAATIIRIVIQAALLRGYGMRGV